MTWEYPNNLIVNGGFEWLNESNVNGFSDYTGDDDQDGTSEDGWDGNLIGSNYTGQYEGDYSLTTFAYSNAYAYQPLTLEPGESYTLDL